MKKIIYIILFMVVPILAYAQASGGQIKRKVDTSTSNINKNVLNTKKKTVKKQKCNRCGNFLDLNHFTVYNDYLLICDSCIQLTKWDSPQNTKRRNVSESDVAKMSEEFDPFIRQGIRQGRVVVGMTEEAVLLSKGEPDYTAKSEDRFYDWIYILEKGDLIVYFDENNRIVLKTVIKRKR